ncbi:LAME_0F05006g1_1 [Lachancea meyersii CBS 8951]|uniref:LAME_0F05006g1_1 n=1 Tax=Lachancea meyersii CBS 8951 TaxID=1266667 RepID=A0A1G4JSN6_9SACH|nr:LAME_0F05006g1_1 [Lachancea meyersii CBS 8951]
MPRVIVSVGGGHITEIHRTVLQIQKALLEAFVDTAVVIADLDDTVTSKERNYSDSDYNFEQILARVKNAEALEQWEVVLVCGRYALFDSRINELAQLKVFLDSDGDRRLIDLIQRFQVQSSEQLADLIQEYLSGLRPEMQKYIEPTRAHADLIIPSNGDSVGAAIVVDSIVKIVEDSKGGAQSGATRLYPQLDFQAESLDIEKEQYQDLS